MISLPDMLLVRQDFPDRRIDNIPAAIQQQMREFPIAEQLQPGARIAIGVGSRGINGLAVIVRPVVDFWKEKGFKPFIFPAMGSHGGGTPEGQKQILTDYGVTEAAMGCPIISSMETVETGRTPEGIDTFMDRSAHESGGVFLINRVKPHTDFEGKNESGLYKMASIGMGKAIGAATYHDRAFIGDLDLGQVILSVGRHMVATQKILGGLAVLEDANNNTTQLIAMPAAHMESMEENALKLVKSWRGYIPMDLDVLIVDEIGKDKSGPGMDTGVINRSSTTLAYNPWKDRPWIGRIYARSLSEKSHGNGMGVGLADVVHDRLLADVDWKTTQLNAITATIPRVASTPLHYPTDQECLEVVVRTTGMAKQPSNIRIGWIQNTLILNTLALSENLRPQIEANPKLEIIGKAEPFAFNAEGQLALRPFGQLGVEARPLRNG